MSQLSVNDHLEGILSDFEALKRSFDMEDAEEAPAVLPSCPFGSSTPADSLAAGNGESGRLASLMPPTHQSRISLSSSPSPAQSPVLKTRISTSFSFNRGTIQLARANGAVNSSLTRVASFQARLDPNGFSSSLGLGSESLHSSSSSLECPPPPSTPQSAARQPEPRGLKAAPVASPALKKFSSHSNVFHSEAEQPIQLVSKAGVNHGSLPSLDLHIAEDQGSPIPLAPALAFHSAGAWSSSSQNCALLRGKSSTPISREPSFSSSSSSSPLSDAAQRPSLSPPPPPFRQPTKLQKFPLSLDGLVGKPLDGSDPAPSADSASRPLPRTQLQLSLSTSPSLSRQPGPGRAKEGAAAASVSGVSAAPSPGKCPGAQVNESPWPPSRSPAQAAPFRLMSRPQIMQVTSQPSFLGGPAACPREHVRSMAERVNSFSSSEVSGLGAPAPSSYPREVPYMGPAGSPRVSSVSEEMQGREKTKEGSSPEPGCISMEGQPVQPAAEETPRNTNPANVGLELFGYVGIEAVLDQMRIKTMKTGFEFNLMVVGQSGLGKSTMVNTLFKSKVSRKPTGPGYEEHIPKTVQLQSVTHVIEEKGVKMKLTVTDTPGFGDQINNENCWDPIIKYINEQYEKYLREEILISRKRKIPDTRVHSCVYFVPPTGHWLRPLDLEFMRRLSKIVNVVPVIAKADTLTLEERAEFKQRIQKDLKAHGISVYPQEDFDDNPDDRILNDKIRDKIPFAVVGADKEHQWRTQRTVNSPCSETCSSGPTCRISRTSPTTCITRATACSGSTRATGWR
ncbi:septin-12 isoform X2 [Malaclemys terrapin pileata]|uniref:septin-12 isoform X2 n=1 Tax=Malaclemys terrapin pileata TaxID=2991368 RepID=UPI0023A8F83C|nr:septin-12 isoform X2 [Malaclemys terrapin pileata]